MRNPNYVKFVDYFEEQFNKIDTESITYLTPSDKLSLVLSNVKRDYILLHCFSIITFFAIMAISSYMFHFITISFVTQKLTTGLAFGSVIGLIVYISLLQKTHLNFTKYYFFTMLSDRVKDIKEFIDNKSLNYSENEDECINLLKSSSPLLDIKEKTACMVYYELSKRTDEINTKYENIEKLYLFYLFLAEELDYKTTDMEFNHILGAILKIAPDSLRGTELTKLNLLKKFHRNEKGLEEHHIEKVKKTLLIIKEKVNINDFIDQLLEKKYIP